MKKIDGIAKSVSDVLKGNKYAIDYYQREYKWEAKQLQELINDLTAKFEEAWDPDHARDQVEKYPYYFLGSIIVSEKDGVAYIVDGQQRLTSLTLLLTFLRRSQAGQPDEVDVDDLVLSVKYGNKSFNLDVPDREVCMTALFEHGAYLPPDDASESVRTLAARFNELEEIFPAALMGPALPYFLDWLQHRVQIVQITAYTDDDAYTIFETMNDRGLKLTPADMLKGYLLANIDEGAPRAQANELWRQKLRGLADIDRAADSDFLKTWLRSQYALKIRERKKAARPEDWDRIGTEFHRWLRGAVPRLGLTSSRAFSNFVGTEFAFYGEQYRRVLLEAAGTSTAPELRHVAYNADHGFTLQHQLLLAPLRSDDTPEHVTAKLSLVARYVDILLAWRIWNYRSIAYSTMQYAMFVVMRDIRGLAVQDLAEQLHASLMRESETFDSNDHLRVHQQNRYQLHRLLARITDHVGAASGEPSRYREYVNGTKVRYEVEHIWANHADRHVDEFTHAYDFGEHRNLIGGLLLLPKSFNASYNDADYATKLPHYLSQNMLARSLHPQCYDKNPDFVAYVKSSGLPFRPHPEFKKADMIERGDLYRQLAKQVWDSQSLLDLAAGLA